MNEELDRFLIEGEKQCRKPHPPKSGVSTPTAKACFPVCIDFRNQLNQVEQDLSSGDEELLNIKLEEKADERRILKEEKAHKRRKRHGKVEEFEERSEQWWKL